MRSNRTTILIGLIGLLLLYCALTWHDRHESHVDVARPAAKLATRLKELSSELSTNRSPTEVSAKLAELDAVLRSEPPSEVVTALIALLDSGVDSSTGLAFKIGPGGDLVSAPTLRVWLLDQLGRVDVVAGAGYAARIYARHGSADEWAIALRNDWREAAPTGRIEAVRARALELIEDREWAKQPSVGFLEAVDLCVATMAWESVPRLEQWLDPTQPKALRGGAWVALDRLMLEVPEDFLPVLVRRPEWLSSQPLMRAGLVARANLESERARRAAEEYLQRDDVTATEGKRFFELLPNVSATVSHNLVTTARTPTPQQAAHLDRAALAGVRAWRRQPRFARWNSDLAAAEIRLAEAVASATRGGYLMP